MPRSYDPAGPKRGSAEQAQHAATAIHRLDLAHAADDAFIHAMHVGTVWTMLIALCGAAVLVIALRPPESPRTRHRSRSTS